MPNVVEFFLEKGLAVGDMALLAGLFIVWPLAGSISMWRNPPEKLDATESVKLETYAYTFWTLWISAGLVLGWWIFAGRPLDALGFRIEWNTPTRIVCVVVALLILYGAVDLARTFASRRQREKFRNQIKSIRYAKQMIPTTGRAYRRAMVLSFTAGVTEEIIFRGYLIWALSVLMHPWAAGAVSAALFVFLHRYQGLTGMVYVTMITGILTVLFLISGSLWPVIVLHIMIDVLAITRSWVAVRKE
jgi:membrane protease YdiL (CAAX protease family)